MLTFSYGCELEPLPNFQRRACGNQSGPPRKSVSVTIKRHVTILVTLRSWLPPNLLRLLNPSNQPPELPFVLGVNRNRSGLEFRQLLGR